MLKYTISLNVYARALSCDAYVADDLVQDPLVRALHSELLLLAATSGVGSMPS
jgi:DNA-directed RNA polymerase specialized sigma24 family protein